MRNLKRGTQITRRRNVPAQNVKWQAKIAPRNEQQGQGNEFSNKNATTKKTRISKSTPQNLPDV